MEAPALLLTLSQMALAVAGFSGITIAFLRTPGRLTALEAYRYVWMFGASFGAMFLALLPAALMVVDVSPRAASRVAAGALVAFTLTWYGILIGPTRRFLRESPAVFHRPILFALAAGHAANVLVQGAVAAGAWGARADGIFACGILWLLFHAAYQFSRILFVRPSE